MRAEVIDRRVRKYRPRRTLSDRVREALLTLSEAQGQVFSHEEEAWASITFAGTRHELTLNFDGPEAVMAGERFIAALPDHEFTIPRQLVADAVINSVSHTMLPAPRMVVTATLLLLENV